MGLKKKNSLIAPSGFDDPPEACTVTHWALTWHQYTKCVSSTGLLRECYLSLFDSQSSYNYPVSTDISRHHADQGRQKDQWLDTSHHCHIYIKLSDMYKLPHMYIGCTNSDIDCMIHATSGIQMTFMILRGYHVLCSWDLPLLGVSPCNVTLIVILTSMLACSSCHCFHLFDISGHLYEFDPFYKVEACHRLFQQTKCKLKFIFTVKMSKEVTQQHLQKHFDINMGYVMFAKPCPKL